MNKPISIPTQIGFFTTVLSADNDPVLVKNMLIYNLHNNGVSLQLNYVTGIGSSFTFYDQTIGSKDEVSLTNLIVVNPYDRIEAISNHDNMLNIISHTVIL